jgi:hypothetical protein
MMMMMMIVYIEDGYLYMLSPKEDFVPGREYITTLGYRRPPFALVFRSCGPMKKRPPEPVLPDDIIRRHAKRLRPSFYPHRPSSSSSSSSDQSLSLSTSNVIFTEERGDR